MKKIFLLIFMAHVVCSSCSKDNSDEYLLEKDNENVCVSCKASLYGSTTSPAMFCGPKNKAKQFESEYRKINKIVNARVDCKYSYK